MATIALRANNPAGLTNAQLDANFTNLNNDKVETSYLANTFPGSTNITTLGTITAGTWNGSTIAVSRGGTGTTTSTGSGSVVLSTSPSLTTPSLGVASATSINKVAITAPATSATLTIADGKTLTASNTLTFTGTDGSSVAFGAGGTVVYTSNKLSALSATTSAELAGVISDETGTGKLVFATSPTFTTSIVTDSTTFSIANTTATTLNIGGAASTISIGATTSTTTVNDDLIVTGNLTVNGTTTTINSTSIAVDDIAIELGVVATPTDTTANGGGIILKGTTNKTFLWNSTDVAWNSSESINVASGKAFEIAGTAILTSTALASSVVTSSLTSVGTIGTGTWQGSVINSTYGGTGVNNGGRTITLNTGNLTLTAQSGGSSVTVPASGTLYASGQTDVALGDGGTGASLSAVNGGVVYSTASAMAISAAGTAGQLLVSAGAAAPAFASFDFATHAPDSSFKKVVRVATTGDLGASTFSSNVLTGYSNTTGAISAVSTAGSTTVTFSTGDLAKIKAGATISTPSVYIPAGLTLTPATTTTATLSSATRSLTTTAASGTGTTATLTFASQTYAPYAVGATIVVAGVTPTAYNGTFTVTACTTTTVSYSSTATGTQTVAGTVTQTVGAGTANITATQSIAALSIDGVTMAVGDRVLVKDQRTLGGLTVTDAAKYNGIYSVTAIGSSSAAWTLTRTADADSASDLDSALVNVSVGTSNYGKTYKTRFSGTSTLNTTEMWWGRLADVNSSGYINTPTTAVGIDIATDTETILLKSGAVADLVSNSIGIKTITSTAASTYTRASSLYIAGAPVASTNATITTAYALYVAGGSTYLGGAVTTGSTINGLTLASTSISAAGGLTVSAAGTLSLSTSTTNAISIDTGTTGGISIGTNANAKNITIGNTTSSSEINLIAGAAALDASVGIVVSSNTSIVGTATAGSYTSQDTVIGTPFYSTVTVASGASSYAPAVKVRMVGGTRTRFHSIGALHNSDNTVDTVIHAMDNGDANNYSWVFSNTGNFTSPGNVTAYSDARLKSNVETIPNALEKTKQLRGVTFIKDGMTGMGVIAQEVKEVIPEVVIEGKDEDKTLSVAYGNMVGLLIEAIKEQQKQIDDLKSQIASLK